MDKEIAIRVEELSKKYTIGKQKDGNFRSSLGNLFSWKNSNTEEFWALKDVSFDIQKGEVVGVIGKNGAGKSTLLKILSQITKPSKGRIQINGRVASLLEVGTGFHPELTGRENIYLNGTILGMTRKEVKSKFDEIIAFSGVEKFIDTPVKYYSSGMYVRLAFAVAANLDPEILIIDEVLAVGDSEFQKKCLGKMQDVANKGRTVLFVSHNMGAVKNLCTKGILIDKGRLISQNSINDVIDSYLNNSITTVSKIELDSSRKGNGFVVYSEFYVEDLSFNKINTVLTGQDLYFVFIIKVNKKKSYKIDIDFSIHNELEDPITVTCSSYQNCFFDFEEEGYYKIRFKYDNFNFAPGTKKIKGLISVNNELSDWPDNILGQLNVEMGDYYLTGFTSINNRVQFLIKGNWSLDKL